MCKSTEACRACDQLLHSGRGSVFAAWTIGPYLVLQMLVLAWLATLVAYAPDGAALARWLSFMPDPLPEVLVQMSDEDFGAFRRNAIAAASAGLGGAVFMVREFYLAFAYGEPAKAGVPRFLHSREIPRYVLLPLSATLLGPVGLALLQVGAIAFTGMAGERQIPIFTTVAVCFGLGFGYHDTLGGVRRWSRSFWSDAPAASSESSAARSSLSVVCVQPQATSYSSSPPPANPATSATPNGSPAEPPPS